MCSIGTDRISSMRYRVCFWLSKHIVLIDLILIRWCAI